MPDGYGRISGRESREGRYREREVHLDPSGQWQWLDEELAKAKRDGKLVSGMLPLLSSRTYLNEPRRILEQVQRGKGLVQTARSLELSTVEIVYNDGQGNWEFRRYIRLSL